MQKKFSWRKVNALSLVRVVISPVRKHLNQWKTSILHVNDKPYCKTCWLNTILLCFCFSMATFFFVPKAERGIGLVKKKNEQKKKGTTTTTTTTNFVPGQTFYLYFSNFHTYVPSFHSKKYLWSLLRTNSLQKTSWRNLLWEKNFFLKKNSKIFFEKKTKIFFSKKKFEFFFFFFEKIFLIFFFFSKRCFWL